jgi:hypothetical protein
MWFYKSEGQAERSISDDRLAAAVREGLIGPRTLIWNAEQPEWRAAEETELARFWREPAGQEPESAASKTAAPVFVNPAPLAKVAIVFLYLALVGVGLRLLFHTYVFWEIADALAGKQAARADLQSLTAANAVVAISSILYAIVVACVFGRWLFVAARNVRALGARDLRVTPGMVVGSYFIPILNLFRPYQGLQETWRASHDPDDWQLKRGGALPRWWWGVWLAANLCASVERQLKNFGSLFEAEGAELLYDLLYAALAGIAILLVTRITAAQVRAAGAWPPELPPAPASDRKSLFAAARDEEF